MKKLSGSVLILLLITLAVSCQSQSVTYKVKKVVDGDTFWIEDGTEKGQKIRLIGINAPESRNTGRKKKQPFGKEAKSHLIQLLADKRVTLEYDADKYDQYGRTLAYVYLEDGTFLNAYLVEEGYAQVATYPPNVKYIDLFLEKQRIARENNKGLWALDYE